MGQFKDINLILQEIGNDENVHPSVRKAMLDAMHDVMRQTIIADNGMEVYLLLCDGVVTDVFIDKAMAEYDMHTCIEADKQEGLPHKWSLLIRQLNTTML
jgi:hypothetical protein